jgi:hypothetical protein
MSSSSLTPDCIKRFAKALGLPEWTTNVIINIPAGNIATMTIEKIMTQDELDAVSDWYVTENLGRAPCSETTYMLTPRDTPPAISE